MNSNELVKSSVNEPSAIARTDHTIELARLNHQYTELYDCWDATVKDVQRLKMDVARKEKEAAEIVPKLDSCRSELQKLYKALQ